MVGSEAGTREYPGTWAEFLAWFPDEAACARYLERLRWPDGIVCGACGSAAAGAPAPGVGGSVPPARWRATLTAA